MTAESHHLPWPWWLLLGAALLLVPLLAGALSVHQARLPLVGLYVDESNPPQISAVMSGGAAQAAGLQVGDVILAVDGAPYAAWHDKQLGQLCTFELRRAGRPLTLTVRVTSMLAANRLSVASAVLVALTFWGVGGVLLWRTRRPLAVRLLFLLYQAIGVVLLVGLGYPRFWVPPRWLLIPEFVCFHLTPPLLLHYQLTFPAPVGTQRQRRWLLGSLYALDVVGAVDAGLHAVPWTRWTVFVALAEVLAAIGIMIWVYFRRVTAAERRRLRVIVAGTGLGLGPPLLGYILPTAIQGYSPDIPRWLVGLFPALVPLSTLYTITRHNLFNIDRLLNRATVYGLLSLGILILYAGPLLALDRWLASHTVGRALVLTGLTLSLGLALEGTRTRVQRWVDRLFYGGWYDYPGVVETVSAALARSLAWELLADILTGQVPALMQLRGTQLQAADRATTPLDPLYQPQLQFPLEFEGRPCGIWIVGPRCDGEDFSATDRRILKTLAQQADIAVSNVLLVQALRRQLDELHASRETLRQMEQRLLRTREEERGRLARELHDGPIQMLIGLNLQLGLLVPTAAPPVVAAVQAMRVEVKQLLAELRAVCAKLHPPMLDTLGLGAALRALAQEWSTHHGIAVHVALLSDDSTWRRLPDDVAVNLYRIAQEALANVARHAAAQRVMLSLQWDTAAARLTLRVQDDGRGFAPAALPASGEDGLHLGLLGMQERATLIGAQWTLDSAPGRGTTVTVVWQWATDGELSGAQPPTGS